MHFHVLARLGAGYLVSLIHGPQTGRTILQLWLLLDQAALEKVKECHSLPVDQIKQFIFGLIPAGQFRLRKWNDIKNMTDEEMIVIVFENHRDRVSQNQLDVMFNQ